MMSNDPTASHVLPNRISRLTQPHVTTIPNRISRLIPNRISPLTQPHLTCEKVVRCGRSTDIEHRLISADVSLSGLILQLEKQQHLHLLAPLARREEVLAGLSALKTETKTKTEQLRSRYETPR